jgi:5-(carboxyamino)imidazole ribonucleotide synthase
MMASVVSPGKPFTIGILGGGQLAKMMATAAYTLGCRVAIIEMGEDSPAGIMSPLEFPLGWNDPAELDRFLAVSDVVTFENEFIDPAIVEYIAERRVVYPTPKTIRMTQDKLIQKQTMQQAGIPVPAFRAIESTDEAEEAARQFGYPYVLKTRKFGYDGYGNATVRNIQEITMAWRRFKNNDAPRDLMAEEFVTFEKELAVMVARNRRGEVAVYPCVETRQENHICKEVLAPAPIAADIQRKAQEIAEHAVTSVDGIGVFGVELFFSQERGILFNEIAPRPHNSGHYTIEANHCSQFENCIRAVCTMPLGSPAMKVPSSVMINLLGERSGFGVPDSVLDTLSHPEVSLHLYGKKDARKGRKMGHLTVCGQDLEHTAQVARQAAKDLIW